MSNIPVLIINKKLLPILLLGLLIGVLLPQQRGYGQAILHDKKLKTSKQSKKDNRKKFFKMEDREDASPAKVKVRTTKRKENVRDKRSFLSKPEPREKTQGYDLGKREAQRPYRPEISYEGYRKSKKRNKSPDKTISSYTGDRKTSTLSSNPGRETTNAQGEKGSTQQAIKRNFKGKSQQMQQYSGDMNYSSLGGGERVFNQSGTMTKGKSRRSRNQDLKGKSQRIQQYSGDMKYSSTGGGKGRELNQGGTVTKGKSKRSKDQDFRSRSMEMHRFSGYQKVQQRGGGAGSRFEGDLKASSPDYKGKSQRIQQYSGDMKYSSVGRGKGRDLNYSGKMAKGRSKKSKDQDFRSRSKEMHQFAGFQKVQATQKSRGSQFEGRMRMPSLAAKTNYFKKLSKKVNQYEGNLRIKDVKHKNLHPSVSYLKGKKKNSREQKEKLRKQKISWFRFWKNSDQPNSVKQKPGKPKYDSRESEIWYE